MTHARPPKTLERSPRQLRVEDLELVMSLIDQHEPALNSLVYVDEHHLREQAEASHAAAVEGPLSGHIVAVKDNIAVTGAPFAAGSATRTIQATVDAPCVRRLRDAGALILGTTNLDEFAMGASTESSCYGPTHNPWDLTRTAGGSSGGSAAAVSAYGVLAVGTDTGGSIREPAAQCGIVGMTPSQRAISPEGVVPFASSCDAVGPMAREVLMTAALDDVLRGTTSMRAAASRGSRRTSLRGWNVGVVAQMSDARNSPEVLANFTAALQLLGELGAELNEIVIPSVTQSLLTYLDITCTEAIPVLEAHEHLGAGLGAEAQRRLEHARSIAGTKRLRRSLAHRSTMRKHLVATARHYDMLVSPTMPIVAPLIGRVGMDDPLAAPRTDWWTVEANLAGLGAISIPNGLGQDSGLPTGLQIMAAPGRDARLYDLAACLEAHGIAQSCAESAAIG